MSYGATKYYQNLCPFDMLIDFCTLCNTYKMQNKEIAFRYKDDIFKRYDKFTSRQELQDHCQRYGLSPPLEASELKVPLAVTSADHWRERCTQSYPLTVAVGAVFPGLDRKFERSNADLQKYAPLTFDVDMEDFLKGPQGLTRFCTCPPRRVCDQCFKHILRPAMKTLNTFLQDMGFRAILFVYSGRRGFNCFVLDRKVWSWTADQRAGLVARVPATVKLDEAVTKDPMHMIKPPCMPHQSTGIVACPIIDLDHFLPSTHTVHYSRVDKGQIDAWVGYVRQCLRYACIP